MKPTPEKQQNHASELANAQRFPFGRNWLAFLESVDDDKIEQSVKALQSMLRTDSLSGKSFLDIGSGSGLSSLAAVRLGARVHSFDYDPESVACSREIARRFSGSHADWIIEEGSVLDSEFMTALGQFDVVYSWGVLHHTGQMWPAIEMAMSRVRLGGLLFIALYNDEGFISRYWALVKKLYNRHKWLRTPMKLLYAPYFVLFGWVVNQLRYFSGKRTRRGMTLWYDMVDWLGGYPYEVARPVDVEHLARENSFEMINHYYVGSGLGCNEYVFKKAGP